MLGSSEISLLRERSLSSLTSPNAFNNVSRRAVLTAATASFPGLARWATWCYGKPSHLRFGSAALLSAGGVQQGDPLGPLLFAAALHGLAQELRAGLDLAIFYLDDGVIAGDVASVGAALAHLQCRGLELGLQLNLTKSETIGVGRLDPATLTHHVPPELLYAADGTSKLQWNFELLGAAVGSEAFVAQHTAGRARAAVPLGRPSRLEGRFAFAKAVLRPHADEKGNATYSATPGREAFCKAATRSLLDSKNSELCRRPPVGLTTIGSSVSALRDKQCAIIYKGKPGCTTCETDAGTQIRGSFLGQTCRFRARGKNVLCQHTDSRIFFGSNLEF